MDENLNIQTQKFNTMINPITNKCISKNILVFPSLRYCNIYRKKWSYHATVKIYYNLLHVVWFEQYDVYRPTGSKSTALDNEGTKEKTICTNSTYKGHKEDND